MLSDSEKFKIASSGEMFRWIEDMYSMGPRRAGTESGHRCEDYLAEKLRKIGFKDVFKDPIPMRVWEADEYTLTIKTSEGVPPKKIPAHYIPYTAFTRQEGAEGKLLYVSQRDQALRPFEKWTGRIVVADIRFPELDVDMYEKLAFSKYDPDDTLKDVSHRAPWIRLHWTLYREAVRRGAAGFIGILTDHYAGGQDYYAPYGFKDKDIHDKPIPGFWIDRVEGDEIRKLAKSGKATAKLVLTGTLKPGVTHNVIGMLEGSSDETFIIACHHDAPFRSAVEDASGCSVVLSAAKHFVTAKELKRSLMVVFTAGHFYGSIGTRTFIERNRGKLLDRVALEYHVEHIGLEVAEKTGGGLELTGLPEFTGAFISFNRKINHALREAIIKEDLFRTLIFPPEGLFGDYPPTDGGDFYLDGVPLINTISPPIYLLNKEDTLQMVARERLAPTARSVVRVLRSLDGVPLSRLRQNDYPVRSSIMKNVRRIVNIASRITGVY